jgi:dienelactone hydrolase
MKRRAMLILALACQLALAGSSWGQPFLGDELFHRYLSLRALQLRDRFLDGAETWDQWQARRPRLHQQYLEMLGLWPLPEKTPLQATVTGRIERESFVVEKLHFQSRPGLYVTANLYLPRPAPAEKVPAVLYLCGHSNRGRDGNKTAFQHHGMWFANNGYVCLILDTLQLGEIPGVHHGTYREGRWWWQAAGYTPAGVECWNAIRALDYLQSRPEVDAERIAVTGISGGGAATVWVSAADDRVKVAVPVSGFSDLDCYVGDKVLNGHCDCMFLVNRYGWEWTTILALIAPRPLLFLNSGHDPIFPMDGNERIRARLEHLYKMFDRDVAQRFDVGVVPGRHEDHPELRLMAYRWINRHLKNDNRPVQEPPLPPIPGPELRVFPEDKDRPSDAINARVDEVFVPRGQPGVPRTPQEFVVWRDRLLTALEEKVFTWPQASASAEVLKRTEEGRLWLSTEPGMVVTARRPPNQPERPQRLWLVVLGPEEPDDAVPQWARPHLGPGDSVMLLTPRGGGSLRWTPKSPPNYVERAHVLVGTTVDAGRVWDIRCVARWLHERDEQSLRVEVAGRGPAGILAAYAALFEPAIASVTAVEPPPSHMHGPFFLNVLRVLDVPDALGLLAPRPVTLVGASDAGFERTAAIFQAAGAAGSLSRK